MQNGSIVFMDLLMDLIMLSAAQLSLSALCLKRLIAAQLLLSGATFACLCFGKLRMLHLPVFILGAAIATGERRPGRILEAAAAMLLSAFTAAGLYILSGNLLLPISGCALLIYLLRRHRHLHYKWNIEIRIEKNGCCESIPALIDTGNRLKEHSRSLPVLIVESGAAPSLAKMMQTLEPDEIRTLPFGVLGGSGEIRCFYPDSVYIVQSGTRLMPAPPCCVAIYPGRIPGTTHALAPPEFAQAAEDKQAFIHTVQNRTRRILLWHFQM